MSCSFKKQVQVFRYWQESTVYKNDLYLLRAVARTVLWTRRTHRGGDVGKACCFVFRGLGAQVFVAGSGPFCSLQAYFKLGEHVATCTFSHLMRSPRSLPRKMQILLLTTLNSLPGLQERSLPLPERARDIALPFSR